MPDVSLLKGRLARGERRFNAWFRGAAWTVARAVMLGAR
jgi:hypothetical protein